MMGTEVYLNQVTLDDIKKWDVEPDDETKKQLMQSPFATTGFEEKQQALDAQAKIKAQQDYVIPFKLLMPGKIEAKLTELLSGLDRNRHAMVWASRELIEVCDQFIQLVAGQEAKPYMIRAEEGFVRNLANLTEFGEQICNRVQDDMDRLSKYNRTLEWFLKHAIRSAARSMIAHLDGVAHKSGMVVVYSPFRVMLEREAFQVGITAWSEYALIHHPKIKAPIVLPAGTSLARMNRQARRKLNIPDEADDA